jgi:thiamine-monophosphate kinase
VTTDALITSVQCFADDSPTSIASKALRVNLSDFAAKGAAPLGMILSGQALRN